MDRPAPGPISPVSGGRITAEGGCATWWRSAGLFIFFLLFFVAPASALAQADPYNVDFSAGWGGCYRPGQWMPIELTVVTAFKSPVAAMVSLSGQQDQLTTLTVNHDAVLTPDLPLYLPLVTKLNFGAEGLAVRIRPQTKGVPAWEHRYELWDYTDYSKPQALTAVRSEDVLIGVVGGEGGGSHFGLGQLEPHGQVDHSGRVYVRDKQPRLLPWDWTGYESLDLLVLFDVDWGTINTQQARAICQWVTNGGQLFVVPGGHPLPAGHPLATLLGLPLSKPEAVTWGGKQRYRWFTREQAEKAGLSLEPGQPGGAGRGFDLACGPAGFGRIAILSGSPAETGVTSATEMAKFWISRLNAMDGNHQLSYVQSANEDSTSNNRYETGEQGRATNAVLDHLFKVPELRPLSIGWIVLLLVSLAVVIAPLDYFVLKRLDRQPWTWVTCTGVILLFTVGAYFGVKAIRGGRTTVRSVSVIDWINPRLDPRSGPGGAGWSTCYTGIFANDSDNYTLTGLGPGQWWSSVCPTEGESMYSYSGSHESIARQIEAVQHDGANLPASVPVSIWSMQCLIREQAVERSAVPASADVRQEGDELIVTVTNHADAAISGGVMIYGKARIRIGPVAAKSKADFRDRLPEDFDPAETDTSYAALAGLEGPAAEYANVAARAADAQGVAKRSASMKPWLKRGAALVAVNYHSDRVPHAVTRSCVQDNVQWIRLVVPVAKGR